LQEPRTEGGLLSAAGFGLKHARLASIDGHAPAHRITAFVRRLTMFSSRPVIARAPTNRSAPRSSRKPKNASP